MEGEGTSWAEQGAELGEGRGGARGGAGRPTNDQANFTLLVVVAAGHHGPHRVIHHSHNVSVIVLGTNNEEKVTISSRRGAEIPPSEISLAGMLRFSHVTKLVGGAGFTVARTQLTGLENSDYVMENARSP